MKRFNYSIRIMRRFVFGIVLLSCSIMGYAQNRSNSERNLRIVFIDHEPSLPTNDIIRYIRKIRASALENDNSLIIYMPNNQDPIISLVNLKDPNGEKDNPETFDRLCEALNLPSHNKEPWFDRRSIIKLFSDFGIMGEDGELQFAAVRMEFYLTSEFWKLGYNETIVAPIFFALNGDELLKKDFNFDVYINPKDKPIYEEGKPFGFSNLGNINQYIDLYDYDF